VTVGVTLSSSHGEDGGSGHGGRDHVELALANLVADLCIDLRQMLSAERRGFIVVLTQLVASMANAKGQPDEAVKHLNEAMKHYQKWEERVDEIAGELKERSHLAMKLAAEIGGVSEEDIEKLNARLDEAENG